MITIRFRNLTRLAPHDLSALIAIAQCYGAQFHYSLLSAKVVLLGDLVQPFLMTVQRDVLPIEISKSL